MDTCNFQGDNVKDIKSSLGNTDCAEHKSVYLKWPQEACFIGPDRRRVKYNELTQSQWTVGLTVRRCEKKPVVQKNMFTYLASLLQDVCDYGFKPSMRSHALLLSN